MYAEEPELRKGVYTERELKDEIEWRNYIRNAPRIYVGNRIPLCPCGCGATNVCLGTRNRLAELGRYLDEVYRASPKCQAEIARWRAWQEKFNSRPGDHV